MGTVRVTFFAAWVAGVLSVTMNHLHGEFWQCIRFPIGKAVFDGDVLPLDPAVFFQSLRNPGGQSAGFAGGKEQAEAVRRRSRLLRARGERRYSRTAE
jgi:hypothetical protein